MRIIGLCGRSGSGKGFFSSVAQKNGFFVVDCDAIYKDLVSKPTALLSELQMTFGENIVKNGALDRRVLAPIVFSDKEKLKTLNSIAHKYIRIEIENVLSEIDSDSIVLLDAPTLFESGIDNICDLIIGIVASDEVCISRIMKRDSLTESEAQMRLKNQNSLEFIVNNCDCIIYNDLSLDEFESSSINVIKQIKEGTL